MRNSWEVMPLPHNNHVTQPWGEIGKKKKKTKSTLLQWPSLFCYQSHKQITDRIHSTLLKDCFLPQTAVFAVVRIQNATQRAAKLWNIKLFVKLVNSEGNVILLGCHVHYGNMLTLAEFRKTAHPSICETLSFSFTSLTQITGALQPKWTYSADYLKCKTQRV